MRLRSGALKRPLEDDEVLTQASDDDVSIIDTSDCYTRRGVLGVGTYGSVFEVEDGNGDRWALKEHALEHDGGSGIDVAVLREISLLRRLNHPHIVAMHRVVVEDSGPLLTVLGRSSMSLDVYAKQRPGQRLEAADAWDVMRQVALGLRHCHSMAVAHRDLKPKNVLVDTEGHGVRAVLCDFGEAKRLVPGRANTYPCGTVTHMAPEMLLGDRHYDLALDMWSLGCLHAELRLGFGSSFFTRPGSEAYASGSGPANEQQVQRIVETPPEDKVQMEKMSPGGELGLRGARVRHQWGRGQEIPRCFKCLWSGWAWAKEEAKDKAKEVM